MLLRTCWRERRGGGSLIGKADGTAASVREQGEGEKQSGPRPTFVPDKSDAACERKRGWGSHVFSLSN